MISSDAQVLQARNPLELGSEVGVGPSDGALVYKVPAGRVAIVSGYFARLGNPSPTNAAPTFLAGGVVLPTVSPAYGETTTGLFDKPLILGPGQSVTCDNSSNIAGDIVAGVVGVEIDLSSDLILTPITFSSAPVQAAKVPTGFRAYFIPSSFITGAGTSSADTMRAYRVDPAGATPSSANQIYSSAAFGSGGATIQDLWDFPYVYDSGTTIFYDWNHNHYAVFGNLLFELRSKTEPTSMDRVTVAAKVAAGGGGGGGDVSNPLSDDLSAGGHTITDLVDPTDDQDAATKAYVDDNSGGGGGPTLTGVTGEMVVKSGDSAISTPGKGITPSYVSQAVTAIASGVVVGFWAGPLAGIGYFLAGDRADDWTVTVDTVTVTMSTNGTVWTLAYVDTSASPTTTTWQVDTGSMSIPVGQALVTGIQNTDGPAGDGSTSFSVSVSLGKTGVGTGSGAMWPISVWQDLTAISQWSSAEDSFGIFSSMPDELGQAAIIDDDGFYTSASEWWCFDSLGNTIFNNVQFLIVPDINGSDSTVAGNITSLGSLSLGIDADLTFSGGKTVKGLPDPTDDGDAASKSWVLANAGGGGVANPLTGDLDAGGFQITNVFTDGTSDGQAVNYVFLQSYVSSNRVTSANGGGSIQFADDGGGFDGVPGFTFDSVTVLNQTTGSDAVFKAVVDQSGIASFVVFDSDAGAGCYVQRVGGAYSDATRQGHFEIATDDDIPIDIWINGFKLVTLTSSLLSTTLPFSCSTVKSTGRSVNSVSPSSGTSFQLSTTQDCQLVVPVTFNSTVSLTATCVVAISPNNSTFTTLVTKTYPVGVALAGSIDEVGIQVPAGWYVKLTVAQAVIGTGHWY